MGEIHAIPTKYNGTQFRSRLEARWSAFFDLCGWRWEYEPFDLNGWIPDFVLLGKERRLLVEVKPIFTLQELPRESYVKMNEASRGSVMEGWDVLLIGAGFPAHDGCPAPCHFRRFYEYEEARIGWLGARVQYGAIEFGETVLVGECRGDDPNDLARPFWALQDGRALGDIVQYIAGGVDFRSALPELALGDCDQRYAAAMPRAAAEYWWREAGNRVQWKAPR